MTTTRRTVGYDGLHREPKMEEIVNYLANHQERTPFPDRLAKQIRNHPFMTQLDFFDTNEEQKRAWEVQKRKEEVKAIATQAGTSEAMEGMKKFKTRADTGIMRPDNLTRAGATEQYDDDVARMRLNPSMYKEHDAESKTLRHERGTKSDSMAQSVRFSLQNRAAHPDAPEVPVHPGRKIKPMRGVPAPSNIPIPFGERIPTPIVVGTKVGMKVRVPVADENEVAEDIFAKDEEGVREDTRVGLKEADDEDIPDEVRGVLNVKQREKEMKRMGVLRFMLRELKAFAFAKTTPEMDENYRKIYEGEDMLREMKEERDASIQAAIDARASGEQISGIDRMLAWMGGGKADEEPSSSSSSAVRPTGTPEKPFAHKVGDVVTEKGKPFTVRSKDFDTPHARVYNGDPNKARQREARLIGA
jgi:hypothetical protein